MELKAFVTQALVEIIEGAKDARTQAKEAGAVINPMVWSAVPGSTYYKKNDDLYPVQTIQFDVLVTASQKGDAKGGIDVVSGVLNLSVGGGKESTTGTTSRIQFSVPLAFTAQDWEAPS